MTLLTTVFAAVIATLLWYKKAPKDPMKLHILCYMYWGATFMWLVDAVFEYIELKAAYFTPTPEDMVNDLFLGLSVIALALVIWVGILLVKDPKGVVKATVFKEK